jgi:hypothetical protein
MTKTPIPHPRQKRPVPQAAQITWRGECDYFGPDDAERLRALTARQSQSDDAKIAEHLNSIAETYLIRYCFDKSGHWFRSRRSAARCRADIETNSGNALGLKKARGKCGRGIWQAIEAAAVLGMLYSHKMSF